MKLIMKDGKGHRIALRIPCGLILNKIVAKRAPKFLEKYGVTITKEQAMCLLAGLKRFRKDYRRLTLIEMEGADGEYLTIRV